MRFFGLFILPMFLFQGCLTFGKQSDGDDLPEKICQCPQSQLESIDAFMVDTPVPGGEVVIGIGDEPTILLSMYSTDSLIKNIIDHDVLEALVTVDALTEEIVGELADEFEVNGPKSQYIFHLNPHAIWHDGRPVTTDDVLFTFERLLDPASGSVLRSQFLDVVSVDAKNTDTIVITVDQIRSDFLLALANVMILPAHVFGKKVVSSHPVARAPIGSGPFKFKTWQTNNYIQLVRNSDYRGVGSYVDRVTYKIVTNTQVAFDLFKADKLDIISDVGGNIADELSDGLYFTFPKPIIEMWVYNMNHPALGSNAVRKAISMLIDRTAIECSVLNCMAAALDNPWIPRPQNNQSIDPQAARQLLTAAGWKHTAHNSIREKNGVPLAFTLLVPNEHRNAVRMATVVQQDLKKAGIQMNINKVGSAVHQSRLRSSQFDGAIVTIEFNNKLDPRPLFHSDSISSGRNVGQYSDGLTDQLIDQLGKAADFSNRRRLQLKLTAHLAQTQPATFTFRPLCSMIGKKRLKGLTVRNNWIDERALYWPKFAEALP